MTMDMTERVILYKEAYDKWGFELQIMTLVEELLELSTELIRFTHRPWRSDAKNLADEVADVQIMLDQLDFVMCLEHDETWLKRVVQAKENKLKRLREMLKE